MSEFQGSVLCLMLTVLIIGLGLGIERIIEAIKDLTEAIRENRKQL